MKYLRFNNTQLFEAFVKSARYLVRLNSRQDVWEHLGKFIETHFPADWTALVRQDPVDGVFVQHCTLPEEAAARIIGTDEVKNLIADTLNTGFPASRVVLAPRPSMTAFLPIAGEQKVILIGHGTTGPIPKELLDTYLAIAGLAATTFERLRAQDEIKKLNEDLERRIIERTEGLAAVNEELRREIVERKRAEEALRESEAQFRTFADAIPTLCWMANADGWIFWYNKRWYEYTGTTPEQMEGWGWQSVHDPEALPEVMERWKASLATEQPFDMTFPLRGADGVFRPFLTRVIPVRDQDGKIVRWFGTNTDITEQKRSEDELEDLVNERTAELAAKNAQLADEITEREQAEEALRLAGIYNRSLIEASLDPLVTIGPDGKVTDVNAATEAITGYLRNSLIGTDFSDYFTDPDMARAGYQQVFREGAVRDYPLEVRHKDGHTTPVLYNASVYKDGSGNIIGVFAAARDITGQKRAEQAVRKSEERYRSLIIATAQIVWTTDANGQVLEDMPSWREYTGQSYDEIKGSGWALALHPDDRARTIEVWARAVENRSLYETEYRMRRSDGEYRLVVARGAPIIEADGSIREWVGTCTDITEKKRAEEALRESEEKFRLLVDSAQDYAIIMLDIDGRVASWNEGAQRMKLYTAPEIIGKHFSCFYSKDDVQIGKPERELKIASETGRFEDEGLRVRKDGSHFQANVVINAIRDKSGKLRGFSKITRDITEQKRAEDEIRKLNEELEQRVAERTTELLAVNKELEAFTYSVSHDLRAPLRHIHGFVDLLVQNSSQNLDDKGKRYLTTISKAASQMGNLVDDLLTFSRMGRTELKGNFVDLENMVYGVINEMKPELKERDIEWKVGYLAPVYGDASLLRLVMVNLLSNAVKFTRQRDKAVIEIDSYADSSGEHVVCVRDNGVGFDMRYVGKLFGVFQRLHSMEEFEGTGIGLANIRRIISRHGGRTWAEGELGKGAAFYFSLPSKKKDNV